MSAADYLHPEFGYFGAGPRLRRDLKIACWCVGLGIVVGAVLVSALQARRAGGDAAEGIATTATAPTAVELATVPETGAPAAATQSAAPTAVSGARARYVRAASAGAKPEARDAAAVTDGRTVAALIAAPSATDGTPPLTPPVAQAAPENAAAPHASTIPPKRKPARSERRRHNEYDEPYLWHNERVDRWSRRGSGAYDRWGWGW